LKIVQTCFDLKSVILCIITIKTTINDFLSNILPWWA